MSYNLGGKVAIVTGASRGIGRAIAEKLADEKVKLVLNYSSGMDLGSPIDEVISKIKEKGGNAIAYDMDVAKLNKHQGLIDFALKEYVHIDALVNNAGVVSFRNFLEVTPEIYDITHNINARGPFFLTQRVVRYMIENDIKGNIIFISSVTSSMFGGSELPHYAGTKACLLAYTRSLTYLSKEYGIRVNAVLPGTHETDVNREDLKQASTTIPGITKRDEINRKIPLGLGKPEDVAGLVAFLISNDAKYITGAHYVVDGGWTTSLQ